DQRRYGCDRGICVVSGADKFEPGGKARASPAIQLNRKWLRRDGPKHLRYAIRHRRSVMNIYNFPSDIRLSIIAIKIVNFHCVPDEQRWRIADLRNRPYLVNWTPSFKSFSYRSGSILFSAQTIS